MSAAHLPQPAADLQPAAAAPVAVQVPQLPVAEGRDPAAQAPLAVVRAPAAVLSAPSMPVDPRDPAVLDLAWSMVETMRSFPGCVGLAAPQVGHGVRLFCLDVTGHRKAHSQHGLVVMANPVLLLAEDPHRAREGCLSVPDLTGDVARARHLVVEGDLPGTGERFTVEADAFEARAFVHELDHLDGRLFLDRVAGPHALFARKRYL